MYGICWNIATYEAIRASWRTELAEDGDTLNVSPLLFHFITNDFAKGLCVDLRKLTEVGEIEKPLKNEEDRSVYTLASLIADIKKYRKDLTRKRLFAARGVQYDLEDVQRRYREYQNQMLRSGQTTFGVPRDLWDIVPINLHSTWDRLCGVSSGNRSAEDQISEAQLSFLEEGIASAHDAVEYIVNKHFVHAATRESMERAEVKKKQITISELQDLVVRCGRLLNSLFHILEGARMPFLAHATWDKWEMWGKGWSPPDHQGLEAAWRAWGERVEQLEPLFR
jgi:hypothetical protein